MDKKIDSDAKPTFKSVTTPRPHRVIVRFCDASEPDEEERQGGRSLILTGGSSGIGKAAVQLFAQKGYNVFELSRHGESREGITHIDCDVTKPEDCKAAVEKVVEQAGKIDVLISNAGMGISGSIEFTDINDAKRQMDVNFFGAVNITQAVLPYMREQKGGRIIFVSSVAAIFAIPYQSFYSASKFAINAFAMSLKNEVKDFGISVCCLLPGDVKTGFTDARKKNPVGGDIYTHMNKAIESMEKDERNGILPETMAKRLLKLAESKSPAPFNTLGLIYHTFMFLNRIVPTRFAYWIVGKMY